MIKQIFDEIAAESGNNAKVDILRKYSDNELLKKVLYMANSKRVKFYLKRVPEYTPDENSTYSLEDSLKEIQRIADREYTGHDAIKLLAEILSTSTKDDAYIIERIIEKDCKIGMGTTFMNKVFKGLIEDVLSLPKVNTVSHKSKWMVVTVTLLSVAVKWNWNHVKVNQQFLLVLSSWKN